MTSASAWQTANEVRTENERIDATLIDLFDRVRDDLLRHGPPGEWSVAENLAHISEFPSYFATQLSSWMDDEIVVVGRVAEHDPTRNDAIVRAPTYSLDELLLRARMGFAAIVTVLDALTDAHLSQTMHNVKYGEEPLRAYLDRYVIGHKAAHARQLGQALAAAEQTARGTR